MRALLNRRRPARVLPRNAPENGKIRLHLGCGEVYLPGYINVDFPAETHTVQSRVKVDVCADITQLKFPLESIAEIRLHHVFEHFDRATALRLLVDWYTWLEDGGILIIETPDFEQSARQIVSGRLSTHQKMVILRHVFGSHEAEWAVHRDGWYRDKFDFVLHALGFSDLQFQFSGYMHTANITVCAKKQEPSKTTRQLRDVVHTLLKHHLLDDSETEHRLLQVWIDKVELL
jgi:predicted SAM-dependent methyltransferase